MTGLTRGHEVQSAACQTDNTESINKTKKNSVTELWARIKTIKISIAFDVQFDAENLRARRE